MEPVIRPAEGRTGWRVMTAVRGARPHTPSNCNLASLA
ncbi:hypothetical protein SAMN05444159_2830 [Bradyrhizobium lablabi]|uniref:Uncharacterized protein n=1 Tax=Bradyrhizobium lablabi TaxID=722472 RepID=A0A1M6QYN4_9BRAD|nr:hypothetical protein SAMN05444159_2830 [Bradyrhizobium lablabi]